MDFFDKLGANLTNAGRTVSQSAKNFTDTTTLRRDISNEKHNIQQKYAEIGQLYYEKYNNDPGCEFFEQVDEILTSMRHIESLEMQITEVQNRRPELVPVPESVKSAGNQVRPSAMVCMQCGQTYDAGQTYCSNCGQKLTAQYPTAAAACAAKPQTAADVQNASVVSETSNYDEPEIVDAAAEPPAGGARFCLNCGARALGDSVFCAQCGTKLI